MEMGFHAYLHILFISHVIYLFRHVRQIIINSTFVVVKGRCCNINHISKNIGPWLQPQQVEILLWTRVEMTLTVLFTDEPNKSIPPNTACWVGARTKYTCSSVFFVHWFTSNLNTETFFLYVRNFHHPCQALELCSKGHNLVH